MARNFDGIDDRIVVPYRPALAFLGNTLTIGGWVYPTTGSTYRAVILKPYTTTHVDPYFDWAVYLYNTDKLSCWIKTGWVHSTSTISLNVWTHFVIVFDGASTDDLKFYLKGVLDNQLQNSQNIANPNSQDIRIGANRDNGNVFSGRLAELFVSSRVWDAEMVRAVATRRATPLDIDSGVTGYWKLNGIGGKERDFSAFANHGAVTGATYAAHPPGVSQTLGRRKRYFFFGFVPVVAGQPTKIRTWGIPTAGAFRPGRGAWN